MRHTRASGLWAKVRATMREYCVASFDVYYDTYESRFVIDVVKFDEENPLFEEDEAGDLESDFITEVTDHLSGLPSLFKTYPKMLDHLSKYFEEFSAWSADGLIELYYTIKF